MILRLLLYFFVNSLRNSEIGAQDNTDLCYVESTTGPGFLSFPGDDGNNRPFLSEGPIHCHGMGWVEDDMLDPSIIYNANNLFYISMYDHMYQRGYVRNIAGAPMCGCAEKMPVVSRADCTQMTVNESFTWTYDSNLKAFNATLSGISVKYAACTGIDQNGQGKNNDLWAYANSLFINGRLSKSKLQALSSKLVGEGNCGTALKRLYANRGLIRGYDNQATQWTLLAGLGALGGETFIGKEASKYLINVASPPILRRLCVTCLESHQSLYYKRLTPIPSALDLVDHLKNGLTSVTGNLYGVDFLIFSRLEDAVNPSNQNAWECPKYSYNKGFPGACGPLGNVANQEIRFDSSSTPQADGAWHVKTSDLALMPVATTLIGTNRYLGSAFVAENKVFLTGSGTSISNNAQDGINFYNVPRTGDLTMVVQITSFTYKDTNSRTGLMVRESEAPSSKQFSVVLSPKKGVCIIVRKDTNSSSSTPSCYSTSLQNGAVWLKLTKLDIANTQYQNFIGYHSSDGETWNMLSKPTTLQFENNTVLAGLSITSDYNSKWSEAVFANYLQL